MKSESGFSPAIDAEFVGTGADYIHNDPDGKHMRLNAHGVLKWVAQRTSPDSFLLIIESHRNNDGAVSPKCEVVGVKVS